MARLGSSKQEKEKEQEQEHALTGLPLSSSNAMKDLPMLMSRDFLQMTPLS